jgi:N-acetylneuraminic acid mutarotase
MNRGANYFMRVLLFGVLVAGCDKDPVSIGSMESHRAGLLSVAGLSEGTWSVNGNLNTARFGHRAALLPNGDVLVAGGSDGSKSVSSAELYRAATGTWSYTGSMNTVRERFTATLLPNGQVLVAGGENGFSALASAELYDPASGTWSYAGSMSSARESHTATLLSNGKVLVVGGGDHTCLTGCGPYASAELYDPASRTWSLTGSMRSPRLNHRETLLRSGKVLVAGGYDGECCDGMGVWASAELYDPVTGAWSATGSMATGRGAHTLTLLQDGRVLVVGGGKNNLSACVALAEIYDPATGTWSTAGTMTTARCVHTATLLRNGSVLIAGGGSSSTPAVASAELYDPSSSAWTTIASMANVRWFHTATLLSGSAGVLVAGGAGGGGMGQSEFYATLDNTPPVTTINSAVDGNGAAIASGGATLSASIEFTFSGTDAVGVVGFQCSLDASPYVACSSPATYSVLAVGPHAFGVSAMDAAGNTSAQTSFAWSVVTPAEATQNLIGAIATMGLPAAVANSLSAPLNNFNPSNLTAACGKLNAFVNQVNAKVQNGQLTPSAAGQLLQAANAIKASLGCA